MSKGKLAILLIALILISDQAIKIWVKTHMMLDEEIPIFGDWFNIHFNENNGIAFGKLFPQLVDGHMPGDGRQPAFMSAALLKLRRRVPDLDEHIVSHLFRSLFLLHFVLSVITSGHLQNVKFEWVTLSV